MRGYPVLIHRCYCHYLLEGMVLAAAVVGAAAGRPRCPVAHFFDLNGSTDGPVHRNVRMIVDSMTTTQKRTRRTGSRRGGAVVGG